MTYKFRWTRRLWTRTRVVIGHKYEDSQDKMILFFPDGGVEEIPEFSKCAVRLGTDWMLATKAAMEKTAGQSIPVTPG